MNDKLNQTQRNLWDSPWGYVESFSIVFGLVLIGFLLEIFTGNSVPIRLVFPYNLFILISFVLILFVLNKWFSKYSLVKWFSSIPATISILISVLGMVLIMGTIPQNSTQNEIINTLKINQITTHWAFLFTQFLLLTSLGLVSIKRSIPFKKANFGFILNHVGLFIALTCGLLGANDIQKLKVIVTEGKSQSYALNENNELVKLDFQIKLNDFQIDEYAPKLAFIDNKTGKVLHNDGKNLYSIELGQKYNFDEYEISIEKHLPNAGKIDDFYLKVIDLGTPPASYLSIKNIKTNQIQKGWISCGSFSYPYESYKINNQFSVVMTIPEVKEFKSIIDLKDNKDIIENIEILVNQPYSHKGWEIYQLSYNEKMGKWSDTSTLEMVKDPWLPFVYFGIYMMIAGAIYLFWTGAGRVNS